MTHAIVFFTESGAEYLATDHWFVRVGESDEHLLHKDGERHYATHSPIREGLSVTFVYTDPVLVERGRVRWTTPVVSWRETDIDA